MDQFDFLIGSLKSFADAYDSVLRVVFALETGATVLFVHMLIESQAAIPKALLLSRVFASSRLELVPYTASAQLWNVSRIEGGDCTTRKRC
jgi:hypothetical protein